MGFRKRKQQPAGFREEAQIQRASNDAKKAAERAPKPEPEPQKETGAEAPV